VARGSSSIAIATMHVKVDSPTASYICSPHNSLFLLNNSSSHYTSIIIANSRHDRESDKKTQDGGRRRRRESRQLSIDL
jgi:hypothetical protein